MIRWEMLGIEPTRDASLIRKAYAKQLKIYHPEDDAEGYQRLRETYDAAMKQADRSKRQTREPAGNPQAGEGMTAAPAARDMDRVPPGPGNGTMRELEARREPGPETARGPEMRPDLDPNAVHEREAHLDLEPQAVREPEVRREAEPEAAREQEPHRESEPESVREPEKLREPEPVTLRDPEVRRETAVYEARTETEDTEDTEDAEDDRPAPARDPIQQLLDRMYEIYENFSLRLEPEAWNALTDEDFMWDVELGSRRRGVAANFLYEHCFLPVEVWGTLDALFELKENAGELRENYGPELIDFVIAEVNGVCAMGYDCFRNRDLDFDIESYLEYRQEGQTLLMDGHPEKAEVWLTRAYDLFQDDPDLHLMLAKAALQTGKTEAALEHLNRTAALKPEWGEVYLLKGRLLLDRKEHGEALEAADTLLRMNPGSQDALALVLEARIGRDELEAAWEVNTQSQKIDSPQAHFKSYSLMFGLRNRHLHSQKHNNLAPKMKAANRRFTFFQALMLLLYLNWPALFMGAVILMMPKSGNWWYVYFILMLLFVYKLIKNTWRALRATLRMIT